MLFSNILICSKTNWCTRMLKVGSHCILDILVFVGSARNVCLQGVCTWLNVIYATNLATSANIWVK